MYTPTGSTFKLYPQNTKEHIDIKGPSKRPFIETFKGFVYNPNTGDYFGRTPGSWGKLLLFYGVFYFCLAVFFALQLAFFCEVILSKDDPSLYGPDSAIQSNPGLGFRPMPLWDTTLIRFDQADDESFKFYGNHLTAYLDNYENERMVGRNYIDCPDGKRSNSDPNKVCRFDITVLGSDCDHVHNYGFDEGRPCILLKLNRVYGWEPQPYNESTKPAELGDRWRSNFIGLTCEGVTAVDRENIGEVTFSPQDGFPFAYYPYLGQEGYRSPLVMARFESIRMGQLVMVECKAWAANIQHGHHDFDNMGSVRFELLVD